MTGGRRQARYAVLIYELPGAYEPLTSTQRAAVSAEYVDLRGDPRVVDGARLRPAATATTVRLRGGAVIATDGPFADTKEVFGGFYLVEAADLDGAIELAARIPAARLGGCVEIRELAEPSP
jgi:hypothetical protein